MDDEAILFSDIKKMCGLLAGYDVSNFDQPASETEIAEFQQKNNLVLPVGLSNLYRISNGFRILGRTAVIYKLKHTGFRFPDVPEEYVVFGEIAGDGEKICFHEKTGEIVTFYKGRTFIYSVAGFLDYCVDQCKDGFFMAKPDINECSFLDSLILSDIRKIYSLKSVTIRELTEDFIKCSDTQRERFMFDLPIMIRAAVFSFLDKNICTGFIGYLRNKNSIIADNFLRGMKRRGIDNLYNRERKFLDDGKQTFAWNINQLKELYVFDSNGKSLLNAGTVNEYETADRPKREILLNRANDAHIFEKKMEIEYINDVYNDNQFLGNVNNIRFCNN